MRHAPARLDARVRPKPRKPKGLTLKPLEVLACDTIERIGDRLRRYIVTFIDPASHLAFAWATPTKHARHTTTALDLALSLLPKPPKTLLSDKGSEFEADFAKALATHGIGRWYTYPKSPKMNAHIERFNRTLQESFVDYHEDLLFAELARFNQKLADWLLFYNAERPDHSLGQRSPLQFLLQHQPECQMYWTHTMA
jgi:transposase InsO family protein